MKIFAANINNSASAKPTVRHTCQQTKPKFLPAFKGTNIPDSVDFCAEPYRRGLAKIHKVTKEEYDTLTENEKLLLREKAEKYMKETYKADIKADVKMHQFAAESMKKVFDAQYGKGNYTVITIGRSLSSIGKLLALKIGEENVKNIPMSALSRYFSMVLGYDAYKQYLEDFMSNDGIDELKQYLKSIDLSKEAVNKSDKNYIIVDYTGTGESLDAAYTILTSDSFLGNEKRNITKMSVSLAANLLENNGESIQLHSYLANQNYKKYSFVTNIYNDYKKIEQIADYENNLKNEKQSLDTVKLFAFSLLDSEFGQDEPPYSQSKLKKEISHISGQTKMLWNNSNVQYKTDVLEDSKALYNLLNRLKQSPGKTQRAQKVLLYLDRKMAKYKFKELDDTIPPEKCEEYYRDLRPKVLKTISIISQKFPTNL